MDHRLAHIYLLRWPRLASVCPSVPSFSNLNRARGAYSTWLHQGTACEAASVHFGLLIRRTDIPVSLSVEDNDLWPKLGLATAEESTNHFPIALYSGLLQMLTRKHRQSHRHADPRRQQQHTAVAARVTSNHATVCNGFRNRVTLAFDLLTYGSVHAERLL